MTYFALPLIPIAFEDTDAGDATYSSDERSDQYG